MTLGNERAARRYRLSEMIETMPVPAAVAFDRDASEVAVNAAFAEMLGLEPGEQVSYEVDGASLAAADVPLARAARGERVRAMALDVVRADGTRRHLSGYASPLYDDDGRPGGSVCVFQDAGLQVEAERRYRALTELTPGLLFTLDAAGEVDFVNRRWSELTGADAAALLGNGWRRFLHPSDLERALFRWWRAERAGVPHTAEWRVRCADGSYRWVRVRAEPAHDPSGAVVGWFGSGFDVDDVRRAARTSEVFADLGEVLSESLGLGATVDAAMSVVAPEFADWGFVNLLDEDGNLRVAATHHRDPAKNAALAHQIGEVFARLESEGRARTDGFEEAARVVEPGVLDAFWEVGFGSMLALPLIVRGAVRGTLNVVMFESERRFAETDAPFFEELARRLAPAIANAELYERERRVARSFQEAALPASLPSVPGFSFAAIYEAGRAEAQIGGDWYDAFRLGDGRIVISIGDVAGSGLRAAVTMSSVRQAIRGVAQVHADPALMLEAADRTLRAESPDRFVTAFVGVIDGVARTLSYASAGHPPPLVRAGDGNISELTGRDLPLGLREDVRGGGHSITLPDDALLVFYTDGLIESTHDLDEGERRLRAALADPRVARAENPALAIHDAVLVEGSRDDVAILTVGVGEPPALARWKFEALDAAASHEAQREVGALLRGAGFDERRLVLAELVLAELIGNVVRYAPGPVEIFLEREGTVSIVHVLDRGPGFEFAARLPQDVFSESGRGLFLIASLAEDLHVVRRSDGGSHARVVLR